ncbi:MAG: TonB-dependent receptor [Sphingobacteriales bacterium]|nr:MAG: TonB-dependent receptor [Sphingobacteriales bacterium]
MNKNLFLTLLLSLCMPALLQAQSITISGYISEKKSSERLIGAVVFDPQRNIGTASNTYGFYSLTIPAAKDSIRIRVSYIGYNTVEKTISATANTSLNIDLENLTDLKEVVVTAQKDAIQTTTRMSTIDLPIQTIKSLPAFLGEVDIMKAIQLLPGIQSGNEGTSGLYVRGGGPDQNLILLDGVPVYNASHLFGFFSVFNADAIRSVEVVKGGFPARYGGRLSSVIDINMKEGDKNKFHGEGGIGLIASRLTLEGPIQKGKSSFMISGRRTYIDLIASPLINRNSNLKTGYYFYDLNGKVNFELGKKDHIYFSGYLGNDKFYANDNGSDNNSFLGGSDYKSTQKNNLKWGNITAVGRWNHEFSPKVFGNLTAHYSQYNFLIASSQREEYNNEVKTFSLNYKSDIQDKAVKYDLDIIPSANHYIKLGGSFVAHTYAPGALQTKQTGDTATNVDTTLGNPKLNANEIDVYVEDDIRISSKLKANIGLHYTGFMVREKYFGGLQPRVAIRYLITDDLSFKASYVQMAQFIHLLTNSSVGLPTDLWVPATDRVPRQFSHQGAAGFAYTHKSGMELSIEGYYKTMDNVVEYKEGASFLNTNSNWEDKVEIGKGKSYGAELFLQKKKGKFTGMFGYTLSWSTRQFANLNAGEEFPYRYDRRHDIKIAGVYELAKNIEASAEWVYGTGNAITMPIGIYRTQDGGEVEVYGKRNGYRMPAYHRGDVSIKFMKKKPRWERAWVLSVYNVYNRQNAFYIGREINRYGANQFKQYSLFPIIPSISFQFKF